MYKWIKKLVSLFLVLVAVALILNLNVGGRPARDRALEIWHSAPVQKVYRTVYDRVMALIRKDISVEDVFKPELPKKDGSAGTAATSSSAAPSPQGEKKVINMEKLNDEDRKALQKILEKASP